MSKAFICYSRQSQEIVTTLAKDIEELGHNVWFDQELTGGQAWWNQILESIRKCDIFVFALAPEALDSKACKLELDYAFDLCKTKTIIPIVVSEGVSINLLPSNLSAIQQVDYRQQDKQAYISLNKAINNLPTPQPLPNPLPKPPEVPIPYLGDLKKKINTEASLNYEVQGTILFDLEKIVREQKDTADKINLADIKILIENMRQRKDISHSIANRLDVLKKEIKKRDQMENKYSSETKTGDSVKDITIRISTNDKVIWDKFKLSEHFNRNKGVNTLYLCGGSLFGEFKPDSFRKFNDTARENIKNLNLEGGLWKEIRKSSIENKFLIYLLILDPTNPQVKKIRNSQKKVVVETQNILNESYYTLYTIFLLTVLRKNEFPRIDFDLSLLKAGAMTYRAIIVKNHELLVTNLKMSGLAKGAPCYRLAKNEETEEMAFDAYYEDLWSYFHETEDIEKSTIPLNLEELGLDATCSFGKFKETIEIEIGVANKV